MEQRPVIRFEKRGREFVAVARLTTFRWGATGKPRSPQFTRGRVLTRVKSPRHDPKPVDPGLTRVKRRESCVEARTAAAMQALG